MLDWEILNALSDDYESIEQIKDMIESHDSGLSNGKKEILDRLEHLQATNYVFLINNQTFEKEKLKQEIEGQTDSRPFWFGRTENGYLAWQERATDYFKSPKAGRCENGWLR